MGKVWGFFKNALKYNVLRGTIVVKVIQSVLSLTGHQPWPAEMNASVETLIDFGLSIAMIIVVGQAHDNVSK